MLFLMNSMASHKVCTAEEEKSAYRLFVNCVTVTGKNMTNFILSNNLMIFSRLTLK